MSLEVEDLDVSVVASSFDAGQLTLDGDINTLFSVSEIPFIVTDSHQKDNPIVVVNDAFLALSGYTYLEVVGHNCRFLQGKYTNKETVSKIRKAISENCSFSCVLLNYNKKGDPFWNALFIAPLKNKQNENQFFVASQMDVTKIMNCEVSLLETQEKNRQATDTIIAQGNNNIVGESNFINLEKYCIIQHLGKILNYIKSQNILVEKTDLLMILEKSKNSHFSIGFSL